MSDDISGGWPAPGSPLTRRGLLKAAASMTLLVSFAARAGANGLMAVRVWPAPDYTRVTLEAHAPVRFEHFTVKDPERLVVDLEGVEFNSVIQSLPGKISDTDPYIRGIRAGRNRPGVVRLVIELKAEVNPQVFVLPPAGEYQHRLVLDLYPANPEDALVALLQQPGEARRQIEQREVARAERRAPEAHEKATQHSEKPRKVEREARREKSERDDMDQLVTVAIDPGHGGEDPGAVGSGGTQEKAVTLAVARMLKSKIDRQSGMRSMLTREGDYFLPLHHRVAKARKAQADLFVSVHADAWISPDARGSSVFVLSEKGASSAAARLLAEKENAADLVGGVNLGGRDPVLARTLLDLSQTATAHDSLKLGRAVLNELGGVNRLHKAAVEQAGFAVLKAPDIPSILVETAFISNPEEERRLADDDYQDKMADAILRGIRRYFRQNPPMARGKMA